MAIDGEKLSLANKVRQSEEREAHLEQVIQDQKKMIRLLETKLNRRVIPEMGRWNR